MSLLLSRILAAAVEVSRKSAEILRDIKSSGQLSVKEKEANDGLKNRPMMASKKRASMFHLK